MLGTWDESLVRQTFHQDDVQTILSIPIAEDYDDCISWHFDPKGIFSVKSAYMVQLELEKHEQGTDAGCTAQNPTTGTTFPWMKIWNLPCPSKVKMFA